MGSEILVAVLIAAALFGVDKTIEGVKYSWRKTERAAVAVYKKAAGLFHKPAKTPAAEPAK